MCRPIYTYTCTQINKDEIKKKLYILLNVNESKFTILSMATLFSRNVIPLTPYYLM